jgi:hypothetical protein
MSSPSVRVVGPAALKALMAYGGTVLDLRPEFSSGSSGPASEGAVAERLAGRVAGSGAAPDDLILLLADDLDASSRVAARLQLDGWSCVVVVNAGPDPAAAAPAGTPD